MHNASIYTSTTRFVWYSLATLGLYPFYWAWRAWWVLSQAEDRRYLTVVRAFFLMFTCFALFRKLHHIALANGRKRNQFSHPITLAWIFALTQLATGITANAPTYQLITISLISVPLTILSILPAVQDYNHYISHTKITFQERNKIWEAGFMAIMVALAVTSAYNLFTT